jgi:hypothetical protein
MNAGSDENARALVEHMAVLAAGISTFVYCAIECAERCISDDGEPMHDVLFALRELLAKAGISADLIAHAGGHVGFAYDPLQWVFRDSGGSGLKAAKALQAAGKERRAARRMQALQGPAT